MPFGAVQSNGIVAFGLIFFSPFFLCGDDAEMVQLSNLELLCCWFFEPIDGRS